MTKKKIIPKDLDFKLQREMNLAGILRTKEQEEFFKNHIYVYGIIDSLGLESMIKCDDWDTIKGLDKMVSDLNKMDLRTRFNTSRNSQIYQGFLKLEDLSIVEDLLNAGDFLESKNMIDQNLMKN